jgi:hypothetical protein
LGNKSIILVRILTTNPLIYILTEFIQPKMSLYSGDFLFLKERGKGVRERGGWAGHQAVIFKVRLGLGEIEGRDRDGET